MKDIMYGSFSCDFKPNKEEKEHTRLTAGGNRINYPDDCGTPTADMILFKILINSILSTPNAKMHYDRHKRLLPANTNEKSGIHETQNIGHPRRSHPTLQFDVISHTYVYCEITWGMYGLLQSGIIVQELLEK